MGYLIPGSKINKNPDGQGTWEINGNLRPGNKYEDQVK